MDIELFLKLKTYMKHVEGCTVLPCNCGYKLTLLKAVVAMNICHECYEAPAIEELNKVKYCTECLKKTFPIKIGTKITIENSEGIVVEVEDQDHFIVDFGEKGKKWFAWWHNYYDIQMRNMP